jgi:hypothetical protein
MKRQFGLWSACLVVLSFLVWIFSSYVSCRAEERIPDVAEGVKSSVVLVKGFTQEGDKVLGTGFIINETGDVITNYHVIKCCISASVEFSNGEIWEVKGIVAKDEKADIVRLTLANAVPFFKPLILSDTIKLGEPVSVIGNPLDKRWLVSSGIVSAVKVYFPDIDEHVFHHTVAVGSGSSGSPVINNRGEVVGVHAGILRPSDFAIPYAIPASKIRDLQLYEPVTLAEELAVQDTLCPKLAKTSVFKPEVESPGSLPGGKILLEKAPLRIEPIKLRPIELPNLRLRDLQLPPWSLTPPRVEPLKINPEILKLPPEILKGIKAQSPEGSTASPPNTENDDKEK